MTARRAPRQRAPGDAALVALVALAASLSGLLNAFALDDVSLIASNSRVQSLDRWREILTSPYWPPPFAQDLYRPIASLLVAVEYVLGGGGPLIYRVVSYALYAACAVGVFALASRLFSHRVALAVAVLFAAHPVHVEAVALGVNQGELLVGLIAVVMVCRYVDRRRAGGLALRDWLVLAVLYACAALTKENGFVLPGLLLAAELFLVGDSPLRSRIPLLWRGYASLGAVGVVLLAVRTAVLSGNVVGAFTSEALVGLGPLRRMLTMLQVVPMWLRLFVWPAHLQVDYSPNEIVASTAFGAHEAAGAALVVAALALVYFARRRAPTVSFGLTWCAVALFPVSNIVVPTSIVLAERTLFLPSIGFLVAAAALASQLWIASGASNSPLHSRARPVIVGACALLALLGVARSAERHTAWRNNAHLWVVSAKDAPRSLRVQRAHTDAVAEMMRVFDLAITTSTKPWRVRYDLALMLRAMGEDTMAVTQLRLSLAQHAEQRDTKIDLALTLLAVGQYSEVRRLAEAEIAAGDSGPNFRQIAHVADSALAAGAPAGSVKLRVRLEPDQTGGSTTQPEQQKKSVPKTP